MPTKIPAIARALADDDDLGPAPIEPSWILEGDPQARIRGLGLSNESGIRADLWECTAGRFKWIYRGDEVIYILAGEAEVTSADGTTTTFRQGDIVHLFAGETLRWHVPVYIKKLALYTTHVSMIRRVARRIPYAKRIVHMVRASRVRATGMIAGVVSVSLWVAALA